MASGLPEAQLASLRQLIHDHLRGSGVYESLRAIVMETMGDAEADAGADSDGLGTDAVMRALKQKGVITDLVGALSSQLSQSLAVTAPTEGSAPGSLPALIRGDRYLYVSLLGGKAWLDHLAAAGAGGEHLRVCLHLGSQRARSRPVISSVEPAFDDSFLFKLDAKPWKAPGDGLVAAGGSPMLRLLGHKQLLHLVVVKAGRDDATREVVATHLLEWRKVLTADGAQCSVCVEMSGVREEAKLPVGVLDLRLELLPPPGDGDAADAPAERELVAQLRAERAAETDAERAFFAYARSWWAEYLALRPAHQERLVKIFALTEFGVQRPVTTFVRPMHPGRLLESAAHAARFVALIPFERHRSVGEGAAEAWSSLHSFLCRRRGDAAEHALLLCSLLLGFGLDAYVAVGTDAQGGHLWVVTRSSPQRTVFWESLSGQRTVHDMGAADDSARAAHYRTVGCVFNHESFYANCQGDDSVAACVFDLENRARWKAMEVGLLRALTPLPTPPLVAAALPPPHAAEEQLEKELRALLERHREPLGLGTFWDDKLCTLLAPALAAYEAERVHGAAFGSDDFQQGIKRHVPEGHIFKGFPQLFSSASAEAVLFGLLKSSVALDVVQARGDQVRHAVRVKVVNYAEDVRAVWVMVAVKYKAAPRQ